MNICAPFGGIVRFHVAAGDTVAAGDPLATIETVKLEATVPAPGPGIVTSILVADYADIDGGDVVITVDPHAPDTRS
ncbi:biotin/lipoyl-containing protein [Corynebacterium choanae]|nr:biotin/lipoyl-containing protein [Corynebacterium choanae]